MDTKMNKYKLKHLAKFCCKPTEAEYEFIKEVTSQVGLNWYYGNKHNDPEYPFVNVNGRVVSDYDPEFAKNPKEEIPVIDFIKKLRMTEEEAMELEDDRVVFDIGENWAYIDGSKAIEAFDGHHFRVSEDGLTVTLHKNKQ